MAPLRSDNSGRSHAENIGQVGSRRREPVGRGKCDVSRHLCVKGSVYFQMLVFKWRDTCDGPPCL